MVAASAQSDKYYNTILVQWKPKAVRSCQVGLLPQISKKRINLEKGSADRIDETAGRMFYNGPSKV